MLRPLLLFAIATFVLYSLLFTVATQWGTFLHASGAILVLLVIAATATADAAMARLARARGWTRPAAWLMNLCLVASAGLLTAAAGAGAAATARAAGARYTTFAATRAAYGIDGSAPIISNDPVWMSYVGVRAPALPDEPVSSLLALADRFGARYLVVDAGTNAPAGSAAYLVPVSSPPGFTTYHIICGHP